MPWSPKTFAQRHNHSLSAPQASKAARIANAILQKTGNEGQAIRIANAQAKR